MEKKVKNKPVTYVHGVAVETGSILDAYKVAAKVENKNAGRGTVKVDGKRIRWSTIQQFEYHKGFKPKT